MESFSSRQPRPVRRRYQDFVWLHNALTLEFPASIVPPLPEKHRLGRYMQQCLRIRLFGHRLKDLRIYQGRSLRTWVCRKAKSEVYYETMWFIQSVTKCAILQSAMVFGSDSSTSRATAISLLQSVFRIHGLCKCLCIGIGRELPSWFLYGQRNDKRMQSRRVPQAASVLESLSDTLLNAFAKVKKPDERFVDMKENIDRLQDNLDIIERLYSRIGKRQSGKWQKIIEELVDFFFFDS